MPKPDQTRCAKHGRYYPTGEHCPCCLDEILEYIYEHIRMKAFQGILHPTEQDALIMHALGVRVGERVLS